MSTKDHTKPIGFRQGFEPTEGLDARTGQDPERRAPHKFPGKELLELDPNVSKI